MKNNLPVVGAPVEPTVRQHTPGPWCFGSFGNLLVVPLIDGVAQKSAAICSLGPQHFPSDTEAYANAELISAAPDLLSALRDLEAMAERYRQPGAPIPDAQKKARAAIAKAVGRAA